MGRGQAKVELGELMQRLRAMESEMPDKKNKGSHSLGDLAAKMAMKTFDMRAKL